MSIDSLSKKLEATLSDESVKHEIIDLLAAQIGMNSFKHGRIFIFFVELSMADSQEVYQSLINNLASYLVNFCGANIQRKNIPFPQQLAATEKLISYLQDEILYRKQEIDPSLAQSFPSESTHLEMTEGKK